MARIKIQPTVGTLQIDQYDLHIFSRQSDPHSAGNFNTGVLLEDLPKRIEQEFNVDLATHPYVQHYYEIESAVDADIEFDFSDGSMRLRNVRPELQRLLDTIVSRSKATKRPALILASAMNRIGRSNATAVFLQIVAQQVRTDVLVWTLQDRGLLNPLTQIGEITTILQMAIAGKQESGTKSHTVRGAQERAVRDIPNRSLGERPVGYRRYPCDKAGNRLDRDPDGNRIVYEPEFFDHWRFEPHDTQRVIPQRAFFLLLSGYNLGQIAAALNKEFGAHPLGTLIGARGERKGRKYGERAWTRQAVKWMLRNPIYIGLRAWGRTEARTVGSSKRIKLDRSEWIFSKPDESLRLVDDNTFYIAQAILDQVEDQVRRRRRGRPLNAKLYFHRNPILRCAICGGRLWVIKKDLRSSPGAVRYHYACVSSRTSGRPQCQSHDALAIDAAVRDELARAFAAVKNYIGPLREDVERAGVAQEQRRLQRRLAAEETALETHQANYLNLPADTPAFMRDSLYQQVLRQAAVVEELRRDLLRFGESEVVKRQRDMLIMMEGMEAFSRSPFGAQRDLIHRLLSAVWVWPDGRFVVQRTSQSEEDVARLANAGFDPSKAAFPDLEYRRLRIADNWAPIDYVLLAEHTLAMIDRGELPAQVFRDAGGMAAKPLNRLYRERKTTGFGPLTALKMYMIAKQEYFDVARLRADIAEWLRKQTQTTALTTLARRLDIAPGTVEKMRRGEPIRRPTYLKFLQNVGWSLDGYRALPEGIEEVPYLREVVYWVVCAGSPSMFRRITGERGLNPRKHLDIHESESYLESVNTGTRARSRGTG